MPRSIPRTTPSVILVLALAMTLVQGLHAQTFNVLHSFSGGADGGSPQAGLTMDSAGNLYGTASVGGYTGGDCATIGGCGTVFKLVHKQRGWVLTTLYSFKGNAANDGVAPVARVIFGPDGALYGTTQAGGGTSCPNHLPGCGIVFKLTPPFSVCKSATCPWTETVLHRFSGGLDGETPLAEVVFDQAGNLYSTTYRGGLPHNGVVFELAPAGGSWIQSVIYPFSGTGSDGANPTASLTFDDSGNIYGTTLNGGTIGNGTVFKLTRTGSNWVESTLYSFNYPAPQAGVIFDGFGNLFGAQSESGEEYAGSIFELSPSGSGWVEKTIYFLPGCCWGPVQNLIFGANGSLYGTTLQDGIHQGTCAGGIQCGTVFQLTPNPDGTWAITLLHEFTGDSDGSFPFSNVIFDQTGNLYGTASSGGLSRNGCAFGYGCGVVWEITP